MSQVPAVHVTAPQDSTPQVTEQVEPPQETEPHEPGAEQSTVHALAAVQLTVA
jgi:hypothetical protein